MFNLFRKRNFNEGSGLIEFGIEETSWDGVRLNINGSISRVNKDKTLFIESHFEVDGEFCIVGGGRDIVVSTIYSQVTEQIEVNILGINNVGIILLSDGSLIRVNLSFSHVELKGDGKSIPIGVHSSNGNVTEIRIELMENHIL